MNNLAEAYRDANRLDMALQLFEETLRLEQVKLGPDDPAALDSMEKLASASFTAKQPEKAVPLAERLLGSRKKQFGSESPRLASAQASVALEFLQHRQFVPAEPILRESLAIRAKHEPDAWTTFHTQSLLGGALLGQEKYADAEPLLRHGYEGMKEHETQIPMKAQRRLTEALERLVQLYEAWGKSDQAAHWRRRLAEHQSQPQP
jgi:hypothetical protein